MNEKNLSTCSYFNPCSSQHHAYSDQRYLKPGQKFWIWTVSILTGLLTLPICFFGIVAGVAVFRCLTERSIRPIECTEDTIAAKINALFQAKVGRNCHLYQRSDGGYLLVPGHYGRVNGRYSVGSELVANEEGKWVPLEREGRVTSPPVRLVEVVRESSSFPKVSLSDAHSAFVLTNLGPVNPNLDGLGANAVITLGFAIETIETMQAAGELEGVDTLLSRLRFARSIAEEQQAFVKRVKDVQDVEAVVRGKKQIARKILDELKREGVVFLASGYANQPAGHGVGLRLGLRDGRVTGTVFNRGEGVGRHGESTVGRDARVRVVPAVSFGSRPIEEMDPFLEGLTELCLTTCSSRIEGENTLGLSDRTEYTIEDFYQLMRLLGDPFVPDHKTVVLRGAQRGPTCAMKIALAIIWEEVSEQVAARIKLAMRAVSSKGVLRDRLALHHRWQLQFVKGKIARALIKLDGQLLEREDKRYRQLLGTVAERVDGIGRDHCQALLQERAGWRSDLFDRRHYDFAIPRFDAKTGGSGDLIPTFLQVDGEKALSFSYDAFHTISVVGEQSWREGRRLAGEFLQALPPANSPLWRREKLSSLQAYYLQRVCSELIWLSIQKEERRAETVFLLSTSQLVALANAACGLLQWYQTGEEKAGEALVAQQAALLLELLKNAGPNVRISDPVTADRFAIVQEKLGQLRGAVVNGNRLGLNLLEKQEHRFSLLFNSVESLQSDPSLAFIYAIQNRFPQFATVQAPSLLDCAAIWREELAKLVPPALSPQFADAFVDPFRVLSQVVDPLLFAIGVKNAFDKEKDPVFTYRFEMENGAPRVGYTLEGIAEGEVKGAGVEVLQGPYFQRDEKCERALFGYNSHPKKAHALDWRLQPGKREENHYLLLEGRHAIEQAKIMVSDETVIPHTIRYFEKEPQLLRSSNYLALLEALLWTRHSDGKGAILARRLEDHSSQEAEQLVTFLKKSCQKSDRTDLGAEVLGTSVRILGQLFAHLAANGPSSSRLLLVRSALVQGIELLKEHSSEQVGRYYLIALYPYLKSDDQLAREAAFANRDRIQNRDSYHCTRQLVRDDYERGWAELTETGATPDNRLPWWVLVSDQYIFSDLAPEVKREGNQYLFRIGEVETRIELTGGKNFKLSQKKRDSRGVLRWFSYQPTLQFPANPIPDEGHPCAEKGFFSKESRCWTADEGQAEAIVEPKEAGPPLCRLREGRIYKGERLGWMLATCYGEGQPPFVKRICQLDDIEHVLIWKDRHHRLTCFEFPRYQFKLQRREVGGEARWFSSKHSGFYLDPTGVVLELEPWSHYLVLRNAKGERLAIITNRQVSHKCISIAPHHHHRLTKVAEKPALPALIAYSIDEAGNIVLPDQPYSLLYLIHLAFRAQNYQQVRSILEKLSLYHRNWSDEEEMLVGKDCEISCDQDMHPEAAALRLKLRLIARRALHWKKDKHGRPAYDARVGRNQACDYLACIDQMNHLGPQWLSYADEKATDEWLKDEVWGKEKQLIDARWGRGIVPNQGRSRSSEEKDAYQYYYPGYTLIEQWKKKPAVKQLPFELRPGDRFLQNFPHYYRIAWEGRAGQKSFDDLITLLQKSRGVKEASIRWARQTLITVAVARGRRELAADWPTPDWLEEKPDSIRQITRIFKTLPSERPFDLKMPALQSKRAHRFFPGPVEEKRAFAFVLPESKGAASASSMHPFAAYLTATGAVIQEEAKSFDARKQAKIASLNRLLEVYRPPEEDPCGAFAETCKGIADKIQEVKGEEAPWQLQSDQKSTVLEALEREIDREKGAVERLESALEEQLSGYTPAEQLQVHAGHLRPLSLNELLLFFGRGEDGRIRQSHPSINLTQLKLQIREYLLKKSDLQLLQRAKSALSEVGKSDSAASRFIQTIRAERAYTADDPLFAPLSLLELFANIRLRKEQVETLRELVRERGVHLEQEARTGFGKSTVLIPLWLFLTSQKGRLTLMAVPTALLEQQRVILERVLGNTYATVVQTLSFTREEAADFNYLAWFNEQLGEAKEEGRVLLTDIRSCHGMTTLAYRTELLKQTRCSLSCYYLQDIREKIKRNCFIFIDESGVCLDPRLNFDYAIDKATLVGDERSEAIIALYEKVVLHPEVTARWNFEFLPQSYDVKKETITKESYLERLRPLLAKRAIAELKIPEEHRENVKKQLLGEGYDKNRFEALFRTFSAKRQEQYAWFRRQLGVHLLNTLPHKKKEKERYTLVAGGRVAIPCDKGVPKPSSEFASPDDLLNFTVQANLKIAIDLQAVEAFFDRLKRESATKGSAIEEEPIGRFFTQLRQSVELPSLDGLQQSDMNRVAACLNRNLALRLRFISFILDTIQYYPKKLPSTTFNLLERQHRALMASGTVNASLHPPGVESRRKESAPIGNLLEIWERSELVILEASDAEPLLREFLKQNRQRRVLIDVEGYFRDLTQERSAEIILEELEGMIDGVFYYNERGVKMAKERGREAPVIARDSRLSTERAFVLIRQSQMVGTDTPMPVAAIGAVTLGHATLDRYFIQGAGRMRGLIEGRQRVDLVLTRAEVEIIQRQRGLDTQLGKKELLRHVKVNEGAQRGEDYFFTRRLHLQQLLEEQPWQLIEELVMSSMPHRATLSKEEAVALLKELVMETTEKSPLLSLNTRYQELSRRKAVAQLKTALMEPVFATLQKILSTQEITRLRTEVSQRFDSEIKWENLPRKMVLAGSEGGEVVVEAEIEQEETQEVEQEVLAEELKELPSIRFTPIDPIRWDGDYAGSNVFVRCFGVPLGVSLFHSPNWKRIGTEGESLWRQVRKQADWLLLKVDRRMKEPALLALDRHDGSQVLERMRERRRNGTSGDLKEDYYLMTGEQVIASDAKAAMPTKVSEVLRKPFWRIRVGMVAKVLTAEKAFTKEEYSWIREAERDDAEDFCIFLESYRAVWPHLAPLCRQYNQARRERE